MLSGESDPATRSPSQETKEGSTPISPLLMKVVPVAYIGAVALNEMWHTVLPEMRTPERFMKHALCFCAVWDKKPWAAAIWSHPVARTLPQHTWLELRRLAVAPGVPKNTPSWMIGVMTRIIKKRRPDVTRLISYQDTEFHNGTIYKAAGWTEFTPDRPSSTTWGDWKRNRPDRPQATAPKIRWEKWL